MLENIDKLIGGIVALGVGTIFTLFWRRITHALLESQHTFWKALGIGKRLATPGSEKVSYFFILLMGVLFLIAGCCLIYQFFRS